MEEGREKGVKKGKVCEKARLRRGERVRGRTKQHGNGGARVLAMRAVNMAGIKLR